jgi:hypothetical protein
VAIRTYFPGDEAAQVAIYNAAAALLPGFKPATTVDVLRRIRARGFDPTTRLYAEEGGRLVGYTVYHLNGRVSYPWCLPGHERNADKLFQEALLAMQRRGLRRCFSAYRGDWTSVHEFLLRQGFHHAREMVNFTVDFFDLPTPPLRVGQALSPLTRSDLSTLFNFAPHALRVRTPAELGKHLLENPHLAPQSVFALRGRSDGMLRAVGVLVTDPAYADPKTLDPLAPCFRLGAFGTEGMDVKRVKGMFSFLARLEKDLPAVAIDLLTQATARLRDNDDISCLAAQVPSDVPELLGFYQRYFRRQASFPVFERDL